MPSKHYDIAIIGGGLAGLSLAIQAASKGYKTILFEKETYPFHKVCGEYISFESKPFLESLGLPLNTMELPSIKQLQLSDCNGHLYQFGLPLGGFGISRFSLDDQLYKIALAKGVDVQIGTKVSDVKFDNDVFTIQHSNESVTASIVAGCYGKRSNIDVKLKRSFLYQKPNNLNNYIGVKYHIKYQHNRNVITLHNFKNGYCGLSAIEDGKSCLCYLTTEENLRSNGNSIHQMEQQVLGKNPLLRQVFQNAEFLYEKPLTISKVNFNNKTHHESHILMMGDAAGMITPLCGNGMSMALHASKLAFKAIDLYLSNSIDRNEMEAVYSNSWKNQFDKRLLVGRTVQQLFGGTTSTSVFLKVMHAIKPLSKLIIRSTHGKAF